MIDPNYVSKRLPAIQPDLILSIITVLKTRMWFHLEDVRADMMGLLHKFAKYDPENPQSQDLIAKMLASLDESLMLKKTTPLIRRNLASGKMRVTRSVQYCLSEKAKALKTIDDVNIELTRICAEKYPQLKRFMAAHEALGTVELAREYARRYGLGVSKGTARNRDVEVWISFLKTWAPTSAVETIKSKNA